LPGRVALSPADAQDSHEPGRASLLSGNSALVPFPIVSPSLLNIRRQCKFTGERGVLVAKERKNEVGEGTNRARPTDDYQFRNGRLIRRLTGRKSRTR